MNIKRILSILMVLVLTLSMLPVTALAASKVTITAQPKDAVAPAGTNVKVTVKASGDGLKYAWYYRNKGADAFSKSPTVTGASRPTLPSAEPRRLPPPARRPALS